LLASNEAIWVIFYWAEDTGRGEMTEKLLQQQSWGFGAIFGRVTNAHGQFEF